MPKITAMFLKVSEMPKALMKVLQLFASLLNKRMATDPEDTIAVAFNAAGEPVLFAPIERCWFMRSFAVNPEAKFTETQTASNLIEAVIAEKARAAGVSKCLMAVPSDFPAQPGDEFEYVRVFVRRIPQVAAATVSCTASPAATQFVN